MPEITPIILGDIGIYSATSGRITPLAPLKRHAKKYEINKRP